MLENNSDNNGSMAPRSFRKEDTEKVIEFHERVLRGTGTFVPGPWNDDMKNIEEVYIRPGGCFVLTEEGASIIAMGALKILSDTEAEIKRMRVEPSRQRRGLGQQILDYLLSHAKKQEIQRVILDTTELQKAAQRFYEKNQFVEYGRDT
ncbi:MAG TPA: GNAT family N-acetyltransferase [Bacillota bacterium]|nr:GNAT family N-acetyltransferase [Bacillota bacterium]